MSIFTRKWDGLLVRNDAAIVLSPDGKIRYILVILGDDEAYYKDVEFLPLVSTMVYEEMSKLSSQ